MNKAKITFFPDNKTVTIVKGTTVLEAAKESGVYIQSVCGGDGVCGKCRVIIKKGDVQTEPTGLLTPEEKDEGIVLGCEARVFEDIEVEIPPESRAGVESILLDGKKTQAPSASGLDIYSTVETVQSGALIEEKIFHHSPLATKVFLKLPPPTLQDAVSDLERIYRELKRTHNYELSPVQTGLANIKRLGRLLRDHNWEVTVTFGKRNGTTELIFFEGGNTAAKNYGVAVDIGTTTVVAHLVDLVSEQTLGTKGTFNKQISHGDDIITRIIFASEKEGLAKLNLAVTENINNLIASLAEEHHINLEDITAVMCAGNTTMTHLLLNIDPAYIRKEPYIPTADEVPVIRAAEAGIKIHPRGLLACAPAVSSYVGGDVTAGVLVSGMAEKDELALYIDMGTNGEMVLGNKDWLACCACSVGPAFEGSGIKSGTRAVQGAVQKIKIDQKTFEPVIETIGQAKPRGICGSGLVDLLAEMKRVGLINRAGKMTDSPSSRIRAGEEGLEYVVVWKKDAESSDDIVITQADINHIIRSKAAIFAATRTLLKKMGYRVEDVRKFYIAGGFGNFLDIPKSIELGMIPDLPAEKFHYIGNGSVAGARHLLLSYAATHKVREIANKMTYMELSDDNTFHEEFISALFLPHTDLTLFPGLKS